MSREELYELAWSEPLATLASKIGITDVAIAKRCRANGVPTPPRGYWAKLKAGKKPRRQPLPESWTIPKRKRKREPQSADEVRRLEIPDRDYAIAKLPPILRRTKAGFGHVDYYGLVNSYVEGGLATKVGRQSIPRALWLWSELVNRLPSAGLSLIGTSCISDGIETVGIELRELSASYLDSSKPRRASFSSYENDRQTREWAPTGVLQFRSEEVWGGGVTHRWQETKGTRMEERLDDVVAGLGRLLKAKHEARLIRAEEEERRAAEEARRTEDDRRKRHEQSRVRKLIRLSGEFDQARAIRRLVEALTLNGNPESDKFAEWAGRVADRFDPRPSIRAALDAGTDPMEPEWEDRHHTATWNPSQS